jgi:hypothetical protein
MSQKSYVPLLFSDSFFKAVSTCSVLSALTTLGLILLPRAYASPLGLEEAVALRLNGFYQARSLVYFLHPFLVLAAAWGVVAKKIGQSAGSVTTGFFFFGFWGFTEALQQALSLVALNLHWREGYARATDAELKEAFRIHLLGFEAVWDALYLLLLTGFLVAHVLYGVATWRSKGLEKAVSCGFFLGAGLTLLILSANFGGPRVPAALTAWLYPLIQPLFRVLLGVWLWPQKTAKSYF